MEERAVCELLHRCARERRSTDWEELLGHYGPRLAAGVRRAFKRAGSPPSAEDVEELLQEVYCRLLEHGGRRLLRCHGSSEAEVGAYLLRLAENAALDHLRAAGAAKRGTDLQVALDAGPGARLSEVLSDSEASPEERVLDGERRRRLLVLCRRLAAGRYPRRNLAIFRLAVFEGWSSREIARACGGSLAPSSIDSVLHRMRRRLLRSRGAAEA